MSFVEFLIRGMREAQRMVSAGLSEYTIYIFKSDRDMANAHYAWKVVHKDFDAAKQELEDIRILYPNLRVTTDFESLV